MHVNKRAHVCANTVTHAHNCTDSWKLLSSLIPSCCVSTCPLLPLPPPVIFLNPFLHPVLQKVMTHVVVLVSGVLLELCIPSKMYPRVCAGQFSS